MCFVKTDDPTWPHIVTLLPQSPQGNERNAALKRTRKRTTVLALKQVYHNRTQAPEGMGQTALHLACQSRPEDETTIRLLAESDPSILLVRDASGDVPIMAAIKNGCSLPVLNFMMELEPSSLFCKNFEGKTPLLLAVEFACATVQSIANRTGHFSVDNRRMPHSKGHPRQFEEDIKALQVVGTLLEKGTRALDMGDNDDSTPLHAIAIHNGPGRLATLEVLEAAFPKQDVPGASNELPRYLRWSYYCKRCRVLDGSTPLHLACDRKHFDLELVARLVELDPDSVLLKNAKQQTALHLLSTPSSPPEKQSARRTLFTDESRNKALLKMISAQSQALRIRDDSKRLPIHCYIEAMNGEVSWRADPSVVYSMLTAYPESALIPSPANGRIVRSATIACIFSIETSRIQLSGRCQHDLDEDFAGGDAVCSPADVDPTLLILWIILSFGPSSGGNEVPVNEPGADDAAKTEQCEAAVQVIRVLLRHAPQDKWLLSPHSGRYANNLRCVLRLIANAYFTVRYKAMGLSKGPPWCGASTEKVQDEDFWVTELWKEWTSVDNSLETMVVRLVNYIQRDNNTFAKTMALPEEIWDANFTTWMFPTMTPAMLQQSHRVCPAYKMLSLFKYNKYNERGAYVNHEALNRFLLLIPHEPWLCRVTKGGAILKCGVFTDETVAKLQERTRIAKLAAASPEEQEEAPCPTHTSLPSRRTSKSA